MFVDLEKVKVFDNVWRKAPQFKLLYNNMRDEMYDIILNITSKLNQELFIITNFNLFFQL